MKNKQLVLIAIVLLSVFSAVATAAISLNNGGAVIAMSRSGVYYENNGSAVPLKNDFSNLGAHIDSLFDDRLRAYSLYRDEISNNYDKIFFSPDIKKITASLQKTWNGRPDSWAAESDIAFLDTLKRYIKDNRMALYKPVLKPVGKSGNLPVYEISGYTKYDLNKASGVKEFLELMLAGAHFVVLDSPRDSKHKKHFVTAMQNKPAVSNLSRRWTALNLHYYYPGNNLRYSYSYPDSISDNNTPASPPVICSLLFGDTAFVQPDSYFQIAPWQPETSRFYTDTDLYAATLWNSSTYGMCPYNEKRATACFIADKSWQPRLQQNTIMPHYRGADIPRPWLKKNLAKISAVPTTVKAAKSTGNISLR